MILTTSAFSWFAELHGASTKTSNSGRLVYQKCFETSKKRLLYTKPFGQNSSWWSSLWSDLIFNFERLVWCWNMLSTKVVPISSVTFSYYTFQCNRPKNYIMHDVFWYRDFSTGRSMYFSVWWSNSSIRSHANRLPEKVWRLKRNKFVSFIWQ